MWIDDFFSWVNNNYEQYVLTSIILIIILIFITLYAGHTTGKGAYLAIIIALLLSFGVVRTTASKLNYL